MKALKAAVFSRGMQVFDYLPPLGGVLEVGVRVKVPLRRELLDALVVGEGEAETQASLRPIHSVVDAHPVIPKGSLALAHFIHQYYMSPLGEAMGLFVPSHLKRGEARERPRLELWRISDAGRAFSTESLLRYKLQHKALCALLEYGEIADHMLGGLGLSRVPLEALERKGLCVHEVLVRPLAPSTSEPLPAPPLTDSQSEAFACLLPQSHFDTTLLDAVTGSGKTLLYLHWLLERLSKGHQKGQFLLLVPEIGLIEPMIKRLSPYFPLPVLPYHSQLSPQERQNLDAALFSGEDALVVGTRSAVFLPFSGLWGVIVDEEQDSAYKNVGTPPYSGRDLSIKLAQIHDCPCLLGSGSPSLSSLHNVNLGRFRHCKLSKRAASELSPSLLSHEEGLRFEIVEMSSCPREAFHPHTFARLSETLKSGRHALVFLNRRGFAPLLLCTDCGFDHPCPNCSTHLTLHVHLGDLLCHHCGHRTKRPTQCQACQSVRLFPVGFGTEQLEESLKKHYPSSEIVRIDRDSFSPKSDFSRLYERMRLKHKHGMILIGTQMSAKGHNFPGLSLVVIQNIDSALFSGDPYAAEHAAQLIAQVAGRAGREGSGGFVLLQSLFPKSELLQYSLAHHYDDVANYLLAERKAQGFAPFEKVAVLYVFDKDPRKAEQSALLLASSVRFALEGVELIGPLPSLLPKRKGFFYWQLIFKSCELSSLRRVLNLAARTPLSAQSWLDIDPIALY